MPPCKNLAVVCGSVPSNGGKMRRDLLKCSVYPNYPPTGTVVRKVVGVHFEHLPKSKRHGAALIYKRIQAFLSSKVTLLPAKFALCAIFIAVGQLWLYITIRRL